MAESQEPSAFSGIEKMGFPFIGALPVNPSTPQRPRYTPDSPESSPMIASSPITGTKEEKKVLRRKKGIKARQKTQAINSATRRQERQGAIHEELERREEVSRRAQIARVVFEAAEKARSILDKEENLINILTMLRSHGLTWGDLVLYVSGTRVNHRKERYLGFFAKPDLVHRVLDLWVSSQNSPTGRQLVHDWAVAYTGKMASREGELVKRHGILQSKSHPVTRDFGLDFDLPGIYDSLRSLCPTVSTILHAFSNTTRQLQNAISSSVQRNGNRIGSALLILLGDRSQRNSYVKQVLGLYFYSTGVQRQVTAVLNSLGICCSYPALVGSERRVDKESERVQVAKNTESDASSTEYESDTNPSQNDVDSAGSESEDEDGSNTKNGSTKNPRGIGLLKQLALACCESIRSLAANTPVGAVYDNANLTYKVAEQILGRKDSVESGTCASVFPLFEASEDDMKTTDLLTSLDQAALLSVKDIMLSTEESMFLDTCLEHTVLRAVVTYGGEGFAHFRDAVYSSTPTTDDKITVHKSDVLPLPAIPIDESSITGNAEVHDRIFTDIGYDVTSAIFSKVVRIIFGDQLSVSRMRSVETNRVGHDHPHRSFLNLALGPGLFHYQIHAAGGILETHWGNPSAGARDPGSLSFHNTLLDRKPIVITSAPPYRVSRDLIFVSLYGRLIHCLELVAKCSSLDEYARTVDLDTLKIHCREIIKQYANPQVCASLRNDRKQHPDTPKGDMVFENATLFLRDALLLREFTDAIKSGDSGRVRIMLKLLALGYRGMGRTKYAYETLTLLHNLTHVWPTPLRNIMLKNWLLNPTGRANAWVPVDLVQEHFIFWTKIVYSAQGSNASWEWLANITPCINTLRKLATQLNTTLGSRQGTKHHTPGLENDVREIVKSLRTHRVYQQEPGRIIESDSPIVPNILVSGLTRLATPLQAYNTAFERFRARLRLRPLIGESLLANNSTQSERHTPETESEAEESHGNINLDLGLSELDLEDPETEFGLHFSFETADDVDLEM